MTDVKTKILIVDDAPANLRTLTDTLEPCGYEILAAARGDIALKVAARAMPDLILLDVVMPGQDGFEICRELKRDEITRGIPVIFITAKTETSDLVNGFRVGAVDYIQKPFQTGEVVSRVETHLKINRLTRELVEKNRELSETNAALQRESTRREQVEHEKARTVEHLTTISTREAQRWDVAGFVGKSKTVRKILDDVQRLQPFSNTSVLITGESGTGKELIARAIHFNSARASDPFIPINCVAIPTELAESILFGHMRGSFTGATTDRKGCFELA
ncbi:MAG: sigma 54-interacting transcriptional regulator, partial [Verrucomicrobiota bacterium]|nr:sigma 54-interacting transcriptional regulator [Verrucomicrobiota bacterium]